jgi:hypothetical protein
MESPARARRADGRDRPTTAIWPASVTGRPRFLLELGALGALAYWGATSGGVRAVLLAIVTPTVAIVLWGLFAAPKSRRRLPRGARVPFELFVFALAVVALIAAGRPVAAFVFAVVVVVNAALLTVLGQWEA